MLWRGGAISAKYAQPGANERQDSFARKGDAVSETPQALLSDAEVLELAADVLSTRIPLESITLSVLRSHAAEIRAASAPVDVFEAWNRSMDESDDTLEDGARMWFAPLVSALEQIKGVGPREAATVNMGARSPLRPPRARPGGAERPMTMKKKNTKKTKATIPIILCCGENGQALVYGYVTEEPKPGQPVRMERARMILYYSSGGTFGLAAIGPPQGSRVTHAVAVTTETKWQEWLSVSAAAARVFDEWK